MVANPSYGTFKALSANATTLVKTGAGVLHAIVVNTKGASSNTVTFYDGLTASGTKIGAIDSTVSPGAFVYHVPFVTGLTVVIATGTAADVTVCYE